MGWANEGSWFRGRQGVTKRSAWFRDHPAMCLARIGGTAVSTYIWPLKYSICGAQPPFPHKNSWHVAWLSTGFGKFLRKVSDLFQECNSEWSFYRPVAKSLHWLSYYSKWVGEQWKEQLEMGHVKFSHWSYKALYKSCNRQPTVDVETTLWCMNQDCELLGHSLPCYSILHGVEFFLRS
jgi:hypothetical protein